MRTWKPSISWALHKVTLHIWGYPTTSLDCSLEGRQGKPYANRAYLEQRGKQKECKGRAISKRGRFSSCLHDQWLIIRMFLILRRSVKNKIIYVLTTVKWKMKVCLIYNTFVWNVSKYLDFCCLSCYMVYWPIYNVPLIGSCLCTWWNYRGRIFTSLCIINSFNLKSC